MSRITRTIDRVRRDFGLGMLGKFLAAVAVGLGVGAAVPPEPMALPAVGTVPSLAIGSVMVVGGYVAFTQIPTKSGCSCTGECTCS